MDKTNILTILNNKVRIINIIIMFMILFNPFIDSGVIIVSSLVMLIVELYIFSTKKAYMKLIETSYNIYNKILTKYAIILCATSAIALIQGRVETVVSIGIILITMSFLVEIFVYENPNILAKYTLFLLPLNSFFLYTTYMSKEYYIFGQTKYIILIYILMISSLIYSYLINKDKKTIDEKVIAKIILAYCITTICSIILIVFLQLSVYSGLVMVIFNKLLIEIAILIYMYKRYKNKININLKLFLKLEIQISAIIYVLFIIQLISGVNKSFQFNSESYQYYFFNLENIIFFLICYIGMNIIKNTQPKLFKENKKILYILSIIITLYLMIFKPFISMFILLIIPYVICILLINKKQLKEGGINGLIK